MTARIYVDTSVIGGCVDEEFAAWSHALMDEFARGIKRPVVSDLVRLELSSAPAEVQSVLKNLDLMGPEDVYLDAEAEELADAYLTSGVVGARHIVDAQHIAIASTARVDILVSWNFRHIVNLDRIRAYHAVNLKLGYPLVEIRSPQEVLHEEDL